ncbi:MAG: hypothetical protein ACOC1O_04200 [bacterium]
MTAIFRDDFREYYTIVFPVELYGGNIGVVKEDGGKVRIAMDWEPPSNIDDKIENPKREKLYKEIIPKLNNEQQKELLSYIFMGRVKR